MGRTPYAQSYTDIEELGEIENILKPFWIHF